MSLELVIDAELEQYLPGVPAQCDEDLEASLVRSNGPLDPITYWDGPEKIVVDGHRRLGICRKLNLPYQTRPMKFTNKDAVKAWMDEYQASRRNLNDLQMADLARRLVRQARRAGKGKEEALEEVASKLGVSSRTVRRHDDVATALAKLPEEVRKRIIGGQLTPTHAEVFALADLPEFHVLRIVREVDSGAHRSLWEAMQGEGTPRPKKDTPIDPGAPQECREPVKRESDTVSDDRNLGEFFKRCFANLGRLKSDVLHHQDKAVGLSNKILTKIDHLSKLLQDWKDNGDEE